ncbi:TetR family transcriptional regulator [Pullulanibacillus sp. KACC 23026]|uniref:TetR/AcrR family transcriptional regulator n=1 Tax=Pullulanibacillus sp. KACC 23026 TaxID=3028315 RepID=UPI0023AEC066|nr:TetR family transcriptional regulator [Pullulanibacillus sp. KACC 23026]WEG14566.1 TetR family transcriptional regulator [Pullulanibacillus sp. KACC 23026]
MPKTTFFNLSKEKQVVLLNAAKEEFSRAPLHEASIANIVKEAGVPRGSFYQYFEDKEDVFFYLLDEEAKRYIEHFYSIIKMNNGELFDSFKDWFKWILIELEEPAHHQFFRNAVLNVSNKLEHILTENILEKKIQSTVVDLSELVNFELLSFQREGEFYHSLKILVAVMLQNLVDVYSNETPTHEAVQTFSLQLELLKRGFYK